MSARAWFCFYGELKDFFPTQIRNSFYTYDFYGRHPVKHAIESLGVPHPEVDVILLNSRSVGFTHPLCDGDRVKVYPAYVKTGRRHLLHLCPGPGEDPKFVLDVHLGKLVRLLRLVGFDALYRSDFHDEEILRISMEESRIILTRDIGILKQNRAKRGYWLRAQEPRKQLGELLHHFRLYGRMRPFCRCLLCNGKIEAVEKASVLQFLDRGTSSEHNEFYRCASCGKIYWKGTHYRGMRDFLKDL
jgi:uncharacterized protein with PIN domain